MNEHWPEARLKDVSTRVTEKNKTLIDKVFTVSASHGLIDQEMYFNKRVASQNLVGYTVVRPGTLVYNKSYSAGAPHGVITRNKYENTGVVSPLYIVFRAIEERVTGQFLELACSSLPFKSALKQFIKEGGRAHGGISVSLPDFFECTLPLPSLLEQKRIVDVVESVDAYVAALGQQIQRAQTVRHVVLRELMLAGEENWTEAALGDISAIVPGKYLPKSEYKDDGDFFVYGSNSVMGRYSKHLIDAPHIVMAAIGAYAGAVRYSPHPSWINNNAFGLLPGPSVLPGFLYLWLDLMLDLSTIVAGSGQPYVQRPALKSVKLALPPLSEQLRIIGTASEIDAFIHSTEQAVNSAANLRSALLSDLLSGAHKIPESYDRLLGAA
jgi:restriction endonuclease S subunit